MKFYEIPLTKCRINTLVYSMGTKAIHRKAAVHYASHSLFCGNLKNLMPRSFTFVCQLYCCSSNHNNKKELRFTFNSCKAVSTSSMALATVKIHKIIKASSYVYAKNSVFPLWIIQSSLRMRSITWPVHRGSLNTTRKNFSRRLISSL